MHHAGETTDPDNVDRVVSQSEIEAIRRALQPLIPTLAGEAKDCGRLIPFATSFLAIAPGDPDARAALQQALQDEDDRVRDAAREALQYEQADT